MGLQASLQIANLIPGPGSFEIGNISPGKFPHQAGDSAQGFDQPEAVNHP